MIIQVLREDGKQSPRLKRFEGGFVHDAPGCCLLYARDSHAIRVCAATIWISHSARSGARRQIGVGLSDLLSVTRSTIVGNAGGFVSAPPDIPQSLPNSRRLLEVQPTITNRNSTKANVLHLSLDQAQLDLRKPGNFDQPRAATVALGETFDDLKENSKILDVVNRRGKKGDSPAYAISRTVPLISRRRKRKLPGSRRIPGAIVFSIGDFAQPAEVT